MREGKVIRVGRINLDILEKYENYITVNGITDRLSRDLKDLQAEIEEQVARHDKAGRSVRRDLDLFASVGKIYDEVSSLRQQLQKRQSDRQQASAAMDQARNRAEQWQREHEDLSSARPLRRVFMRSAEKS